MTDIKKLRELAEAATQGEWIRITDHPYLFVNHHNIDSPKAWDCKVIGRFDYETDMEYFRYANPATILALLDRLEAVETEQNRLTECLKRANEQAEHFEREWYLRGDLLEAAELDVNRLNYLTSCGAKVIHDDDGFYLFWHTSGRCGEIKPSAREAIDAAMKEQT